MPRRVFLLFSGSNDRAIFALARVFRQCGAPFAVVAWKRTDPILRSRYAADVCAVREGDALGPDAFRGWVSAAGAMHPGARFVLVPTSEFLNTFLLRLGHAALDALGCDLPLVDAASYAELSDKETSSRWFAERGIEVPNRPDGWSGELPIVAKPIRNVGEDGVVRYPILLHAARERDAFLARADRDAYFPQAYVRGESHYLLAYLARDGEAFVSSQANLGQQAQGKSIVMARTSGFHRGPVAAAALAALRGRGFHGFAMLEFIVAGGRPRFIEMNPRPWGPLQLCADHDCGIIEAFVGDWLHGDPRRHDHVRRRKPASARYLWLGGVLGDRRAGRHVRWLGGAARGWARVLAYLPREVYLRRDSWKVFFDEVLGG